jgi:hypothetical protein
VVRQIVLAFDTTQERMMSQHIPSALRLMACAKTPQQIPCSPGSDGVISVEFGYIGSFSNLGEAS